MKSSPCDVPVRYFHWPSLPHRPNVTFADRGEIHDLQRYGIGPEVVAFFRNRNQSLQTVGRRNLVAAAVGVFHMDRHGVVAAR